MEHGDVHGLTSASVLGELAHRLMTLEAQQQFGWPASGLANRLKRHPAEIQQLQWPRRGIDEIQAIAIQVLPTEGTDVSRAADIGRQHGLLTNDALIVAVMQRHGLTSLASNDSDFDRVPGLSRYAPV
jgi:uncharacterized protein